ncbi:phage tail protein [Rubritalea sp.]|uniref:phage tail protein n=1 Tax=Rubritalea sp. TaxID=2109375 RepID=UPI003EF1A646
MSTPLIGTVIMFAGTFAPRGWALCQGQLLAISSNTALFSILGTTYGGDGRTTFGLPDLRGRVPMGTGHGPGLTTRVPGQLVGAESVTLTTLEIPSHTHTSLPAATHNLTLQTSDESEESSPTGHVPGPVSGDSFGPAGAGTMAANAVTGAINVTNTNANTGGGQSHTNMQPSLAINFIIAEIGIYPSRN